MFEKLVLDIDGVLTDGKLIYSSQGKIYKVFGPHDKDGIKLIKPYIKDIQFISADKIGLPITYARIVKDWGFSESSLILVTEENRMSWFKSNCKLEKTAFIGDGINDAPILKIVKAGIAPANARIEAKNAAKYVTPSNAGEGAVLDACLWLEKVIHGMVQI
jgi:3-deoxy-D-manno-octulosonate 8-phosphate phosphatase (KDO 8-P phosphatase)